MNPAKYYLGKTPNCDAVLKTVFRWCAEHPLGGVPAAKLKGFGNKRRWARRWAFELTPEPHRVTIASGFGGYEFYVSPEANEWLVGEMYNGVGLEGSSSPMPSVKDLRQFIRAAVRYNVLPAELLGQVIFENQ